MSLATLLVLADGRLPAGGHAHSGGFEAAVSAGRVRDLAGLDGFLRGRLHTSGVVAAAFTAAACAAGLEAGSPQPPDPRALLHPTDLHAGSPQPTAPRPIDPRPTAPRPADPWDVFRRRIAELDDGMDARTPSPALRRASRAQGRALLRAGRAMWPVPAAGREPHHPVALGVVAAAAGLDPLAAATAAAHGTVTGPASAAVRLLGLDPYTVQGLIAALAPECDRIAAASAGTANDPVDELPADGAPLLDIGAEHHASWEVRLFAS
ncbi:urease accessory UreF family protein [Actinoplanes sp. NBRC 103695]|uniref:urease accessory protein UreF n=1 Tax=Actinoplanes sp. NBRC 103695 TaxID=3032202 RepID=UPI0024A11432|nr:urease accessory UreF family protein [Actinoplanes sp. NBRC 103695]GLY96040.1 urease accessory protein UreF [Actinoplanes sp. NBRC 103695]